MTIKRKMLLSTLAGLAIPFGAVIAPFFFTCHTIEDLRFRKNLVVIETLILIAGLAIPVAQMAASLHGTGDAIGINPEALITGVWLCCITPVAILLTIAALWRKTTR